MRARRDGAGDGFGIPQMGVFRGVLNTVIFPILGLKKKHKRSTLCSRSTKSDRLPREPARGAPSPRVGPLPGPSRAGVILEL